MVQSIRWNGKKRYGTGSSKEGRHRRVAENGRRQVAAVVKIFYSDSAALPVPAGHRFPAEKYRLLRDRLLADGILSAACLARSPLCSRADLTRVHAVDYVDSFLNGTLDARAQRRIGLPWSPAYAIRARASVGGTIAATQAALRDGFSGHLAGGTHHAHHDFGAGFCVFNDFAVAAAKALAKGWVTRIAIIDLDVHQGDGNAALLAGRQEVFVFSLHGEKNFPFQKVPSDLDVALPDGTEDRAYLSALRQALPRVFAFQPELVLYQAGVDPLAQDKLGRFALTFAGLMARDDLVLRACRDREIPVALVLGGGYSDPIAHSVLAAANSYRVATALFGW
tara:strand:+ start:7543 stop:8553 length:1011 start_codon:yes stop_codon:yes gene_type:complete